MKDRKNVQARRVYLLLAAFFIAALVVCNLIANKFVTVDLGFKTFVLSAGVLPYPLTFLVTDILSEIYGRRRANEVVISGFAASVFVLFILWLGNRFEATADSPVTDHDYATVFQNSWRVIGASMIAYLSAQLVDVRIFHYWKRVTRGRHLWFRNNFSTVSSQFLDTFLVVTVIFIGRQPFPDIMTMVWDGWIFKILVAAVDTLFIYLAVFLFRRYFKLKAGEELSL